MKELLITFTIFTSCLSLNAQNYIYKGDNQYEATSTWKFDSNDDFGRYYPEVTVAKHTNGGYLMLSVNVCSKQFYIKGTVFVFLSDGSVIKCFDKGIRDHVDDRSIALYNFTLEEIEKLKNNRITRIRYSIYEGSFEGSKTYTADNKKMTFSFYGDSNQKDYYETDKEIKELFK